MTRPLSPSAYRLLRCVEETLHRVPAVGKPRSGKALKEIEAWCAQYDIDLAVYRQGNTLRFDRRLLGEINEVLDSLGHPPLDIALSGRTTTQQAEQGGIEAKSVRERPRTRRVLASLPALSRPPWLASESREYRDLDWQSLDLGGFDILIQVENLDSFYAFTPDIEAIDRFRQPLVIYRGDRHYGGGFAVLAETWTATGKPHVYLGDFDAAGITFAIASQATHLLLPPLEWLIHHATADHLPATQMKAQASLLEHRAALSSDHPLRDYLAIILDRQRGLRQQWFGERLERVPLG
ncbi:hypothetical protein FGL86_12870 [Pistricoccus aurantiacus]|uniref:DUF7281 domain-containing protein n=1 Tax=Pistricoccus aurantiacus TaxID=1883414 RepID=A0A5B8SRV0_9GAMM|nr:hypothetical protein [Pistricoccus aurantiacus]QEA39872.1 hypothetical protein FGL86_12870 [Pistricoccus aurantiacus]